MVKLERSVAIARSSDDVFAFVADQTNAARWQSGILEVRKLTDGPPGVGSRHVSFGLAPDVPPAPPMISGPIVAVLAAVVLVVDRRRFREAKTATD